MIKINVPIETKNEDILRLEEIFFIYQHSKVLKALRPETYSSIAKKYGADIEYIPMPENLKSQYQKYTCANLDKLNSVVDQSWISIEDYINGKRSNKT
jgi:hypothetical protein